MGTEVAKSVFGGGIVVKDMKAMAEKAQASAMNNPRQGAPDGSDYMNFSGKRGMFSIGKDNRKIDEDERWLVNVASFEDGWVCWKGGKPAATRLLNIYSGLPPIPTPDPSEFGPFSKDGEGWYQAKAMVLKSLDEDQQGYLKVNSVSAVAEVATLIEEFSKRAAVGEPCWPVVRLEAEEFSAQGYKNFKPKFIIEAWLSEEQLAALADGADVDDMIGGDVEEVSQLPPPKEEAPRRRRRG
jgi:hypothetical protein